MRERLNGAGEMWITRSWVSGREIKGTVNGVNFGLEEKLEIIAFSDGER